MRPKYGGRSSCSPPARADWCDGSGELVSSLDCWSTPDFNPGRRSCPWDHGTRCGLEETQAPAANAPKSVVAAPLSGFTVTLSAASFRKNRAVPTVVLTRGVGSMNSLGRSLGCAEDGRDRMGKWIFWMMGSENAVIRQECGLRLMALGFAPMTAHDGFLHGLYQQTQHGRSSTPAPRQFPVFTREIDDWRLVTGNW